MQLHFFLFYLILGALNTENSGSNETQIESTLNDSQQKDFTCSAFHETTRRNDVKKDASIDSRNSPMDGDPLVLVPLSIMLSCMENRNVYYLSSNAIDQNSNNVHGTRDLQSGVQDNVSSTSRNFTLRGEKEKATSSEPSRNEFRLCKICGDRASHHVHYGGRSCHSCRAFFRRSVEVKAR